MPNARTAEGGNVSLPRITNRSVHDEEVIAQPDRGERFEPPVSLLYELVLKSKILIFYLDKEPLFCRVFGIICRFRMSLNLT